MINTHSPQQLWDNEIATLNQHSADWLWQGFLAAGNVTLFTGMWKAGKTTLLSLLLSRRKDGGTLAGLQVRPGKTVVVSEENSSFWASRCRQRDFGGQVCFFPQPFLGFPDPQEWQDLLTRIARLREHHGIDLMVIDPLAPFLRAENSPRSIFDTLVPLASLTRRGMAVLAMHHPAKGRHESGQAARGSGALLGHVDISIEMRHPGGDPLTRRRRLIALSRHADTPRQLLIELNPEATDYVTVHDDQEDGFQANWHVLTLVFEDAPQKLTRDDILDEWPPDFDRPGHHRLAQMARPRRPPGPSRLRRQRPQTRTLYRYWFPHREAAWKIENPLYDIVEQQTRQLNLPFQSLRQKKQNLLPDT